MKVWFWSSTQYGGFLEGLLRELRELGYGARQRYHVSEAAYRSARSKSARLALRFRQYVAYPLQMSLQMLLAPRDAVMVVTTNTFYAPFLATFLHRRVVHLVYDLFPEALIHSGKCQDGAFKVKVIRWITRQTLRRAHTNVFLGERLKAYVESVYGEAPNSAIIAVGADQTLFSTSPSARKPASDSAPMILYCGNFGNMHESQTLFDFWRSLPADSLPCVDWVFHCSGPKRSELEQTVSKLPETLADRIEVGIGLKQQEWIAAMERADVALVTMLPGSEQVVMPSKSYSAMMAGQAILAIAPDDSDLVDLLKESEAGWWVEPGDVGALARVIQEIESDPDSLLAKRENAFRFAHARLGQDSLAKQWKEVFSAM